MNTFFTENFRHLQVFHHFSLTEVIFIVICKFLYFCRFLGSFTKQKSLSINPIFSIIKPIYLTTVTTNFKNSSGKIPHQGRNFVGKLLHHKPKISTLFLEEIFPNKVYQSLSHLVIVNQIS